MPSHTRSERMKKLKRMKEAIKGALKGSIGITAFAEEINIPVIMKSSLGKKSNSLMRTKRMKKKKKR